MKDYKIYLNSDTIIYIEYIINKEFAIITIIKVIFSIFFDDLLISKLVTTPIVIIKTIMES